jgi:hypothetical protein
MPDNAIKVKADTLLLQFRADDDGMKVTDFDSAVSALLVLEWIVTEEMPPTEADYRSDSPMYEMTPIFIRTNSELRVLHISQQSPLSILLSLASMPKKAKRAFVTVLKNLAFYDEEKLRRAAEAQGAWEDVYAKRMKNIQEALNTMERYKDNPNAEKLILRDIGEVGSRLRSETLMLASVQTGEGNKN